MTRTRSRLSSYGIAIALAALAILLRKALMPLWGDRLPFLTFFVAILLSARLGGLSAGLLTTSLCAFSAAYLWLPPFDSSRAPGNLVGLGMFLAVGWIISHFTQALHSARARAELSAHAATEAKERFEVTLASIGDAVIVTDTAGQVTFLNGAAESLTGSNRSEGLGRPLAEIFSIVNEQTRQPAEDPVHKVLQRGTIVGLANHTLLVLKDGMERLIDDSAAPIRDQQGKISGVVLVLRDVTERRRSERQQQAAQQQTRKILESINDGFFALDRDWCFHYLNEKASGMAGKSPDELLGQKIWDAFPDFVGTLFYSELHRSASEQASTRFQMHYEPRRTWFEFDVYPSPQGLSVFVRDVTARNQIERDLSRLAAIVHSSDDAIIGKDLEGRILSWNASAERIYGYTARDAIGQNLSFLWPPDRPEEIQDVLQKLRQGQAIHLYETEHSRKDGSRIDVALTVSPIADRSGSIIGTSTIARDIRDRKRAQQEREQLLILEQEARRQAEIASRAKDEFLSSLSHELRNPLNAIFGWARLLRSGDLDEAAAARALETIERNAALQIQLVADLLDVSSIVTGKIHLEVRPVDLAPIINAAIDNLHLAADSKSIRVRTVVEADARQVLGDAGRLEQIVWNLLSNSIKFSPQGGEVEVCLSRCDSHVEMTVRDNGQGIDPELLPFIFDRFSQVQSSDLHRRRQGGLGLGLPIVRRLTELHGGSVEAENLGADHGCLFRVKLPLRTVKAPVDATAPASQSEGHSALHPLKILPALQGSRVLIVDDDHDCCELLAMVLRQAGAQVRPTFSAKEALEVLQTWRPDVLLADIGMPEEDGYTLIRKVRSLTPQQGGNIPAAALTAYAGNQDRAQSLAAGFRLHLCKPIEPTELVAALLSLIEQGKENGKPQSCLERQTSA
jgi:PAS domain S-box-containing protein